MIRRAIKADIIIIGTGHRLQAGHSEYSFDQHKSFRSLLAGTCKKYRVKLIAEEMSEDALSAFETTETNGHQVAKNKNIQHRYVDLTGSERSQFGNDRFSLHQIGQAAKMSAPQFAALERFTEELREYVWLTRLLAINIWPTLFVCGANHGPRVTHLFNSVGKFAVLEINDYAP